MPVSLKNMSVKADELRAKLVAEQEAKVKKPIKKDYNDMKFKAEFISGPKTTYVVRILPNIFNNEGKSEPWVQTFVHMFTDPNGRKRFVLCPRTLGIGGTKTTPCPCCEKSEALFKKVNDKVASEAEENIARMFYRKPRYFVNVLVLEDPRTTNSQKGNVLIWEMGPQVFERLKETLIDQKKDFHDPINGYNLNVVVKSKAGNPNYESSYFAEKSTPIATTDSEFEKITNSIYDLAKFCFKPPKSYEEIKLIMEGKEPEKTEKTWDSNTRQTTERPLNSRPEVDENVALQESPDKKVEVKAEESRVISDDELLAEINNLNV